MNVFAGPESTETNLTGCTDESGQPLNFPVDDVLMGFDFQIKFWAECETAELRDAVRMVTVYPPAEFACLDPLPKIPGENDPFTVERI